MLLARISQFISPICRIGILDQVQGNASDEQFSGREAQIGNAGAAVGSVVMIAP
jgi:hypothetical protein